MGFLDFTFPRHHKQLGVRQVAAGRILTKAVAVGDATVDLHDLSGEVSKKTFNKDVTLKVLTVTKEEDTSM